MNQFTNEKMFRYILKYVGEMYLILLQFFQFDKILSITLFLSMSP